MKAESRNLSAGRLLLFVCIAALFSFSDCGKSDRSERQRLAERFVSPPDSTRPGVYWYFMDGNISREGMTADLESMKAAGIGSVLFLEVNVGIPRGTVDFMSDKWLDLFRHARNETERLGITMKLGIGPGWTGSGGPWVKPEQSMQHLVSSLMEVTGPTRLSRKLPRPKPKDPFFGEGSFTEELRRDWNAYYRDVAVLAYPAPAARSFIANASRKTIEGVCTAALTPRSHSSTTLKKRPSTIVLHTRPGPMSGVISRLLQPTALPLTTSVIDRDSIVDLTAFLQPDGTLSWDVPPGRWIIMRFGSTNNGSLTRPAPLPGVGFECDKFDTAAFNAHFDSFVRQTPA